VSHLGVEDAPKGPKAVVAGYHFRTAEEQHRILAGLFRDWPYLFLACAPVGTARLSAVDFALIAELHVRRCGGKVEPVRFLIQQALGYVQAGQREEAYERLDPRIQGHLARP
jgi:hypothetical protein